MTDYEDYEDYDCDAVFIAGEQYEQDRDAEFRLDAADDAANTAAVEAEER